MSSQSRLKVRSLLRVPVSVVLCVVLAVTCALATKSLFNQGLAAYIFGYSDRPNRSEVAVCLDPTVDDYFKAIGDERFRQVLPPDPRAAAVHYRAALLQSPYDAIHWLDWAMVSDALGDRELALESLLTARRLDPNNALVHKEYGDLLLEQSRLEDAIASHSKAIRLQPQLARPLYSLYWSLGQSPMQVARQLIGQEPALLRGYLIDCLSWIDAEQMVPLWNELRDWDDEICDAVTYRHYFDYLIKHRAYDASRETWGDIVERFYEMGREEASKPFWNGKLDIPISRFNGGLEWRIIESSHIGVSVSFSKAGRMRDEPSIWIHFNGKENVAFSHVHHDFFVQPSKHYRLSCKVDTLNITTDNGPQISVVLRGSKPVSLESEPVTGTGTRVLSLDFTTPDDANWAGLSIVRKPSKKMNNMIAGDAWFSDFALSELSSTEEIAVAQ